MSVTPKTELQKTARYQNDSFDVWLQKTNVAARETGDLNLLHADVLSAISTTQLSGTVSVVVKNPDDSPAQPHKVVGTNTQFTTQLAVGNTIKIGSTERLVISITDDTLLVVDAPFVANISDSVIHNVSVLNLVNAINFMYEFTKRELRNVLIKSIAMS